jgi:uncharacterized NAD(P)/FAD-binding protein YdhS
LTLRRAVVVGGGFTGTLQALQLLRHTDAQVTLVERSDRLARGVAYGTARPEHLLNVRAAGMSAFPDAPSHFADWLAARGEGDGTTFAPRRLYGTYLEELLSTAGDRLTIVQDEAVAFDDSAVTLRSGAALQADAVILTVGNLPPGTLRAFSGAEFATLYRADPWAGDIADGLAGDDAVLLIGTGLTAVDTALTLEERGFTGRILALSRRGLVPRAHAAPAPTPSLKRELPSELSALTRNVRAGADEIGWRAAVDQLRPVTQRLWASASVEQRLRFLRHLRPWWDVHRHRIAPAISARIEAMQRDGRLEVAAGKIISSAVQRDAAAVSWRPRGSTEVKQLEVRRIVNCTGPQPDIVRAGDPLLDGLLAAGRIRPDPCRIGIDVDAQFRALGADGAPSPTLYAVGPMTRGALWEIVAVPDIRVQVEGLAKALR